jgi:hypothetical protein
MDNFNMDAYKLIGWIVGLSPFVAITVIGGKTIGWIQMLCVLIITLGTVLVIGTGVYMITN